MTEPTILFEYVDGTYWIECSEKEYQTYKKPDEMFLYQKMYQNSFGVWRKSKNRMTFVGENRSEVAKKQLKLVNWEPYP